MTSAGKYEMTSPDVNDPADAVATRTIEISYKGKWFTVPTLTVDGKNIIVKRSAAPRRDV
jgi:hypothetical protein